MWNIKSRENWEQRENMMQQKALRRIGSSKYYEIVCCFTEIVSVQKVLSVDQYSLAKPLREWIMLYKKDINVF